jgi:hypothetical protein
MLILQTLLHNEITPVDGEDPTDEDVGQEQLENAYHE